MTREQAIRYAAWEAADLSRQGYPQGARARELLAANRPAEAIRLMRSIYQDAADGLSMALAAADAGLQK